MDNEVKKPKAVFEPAKPGDVLPEGIWIPNRAERRALKKMKNYKGQDTKLDEYIDLAQKTTKSEDFKQYVYMKTLQALKEKPMEERIKEKKENARVENHEDVQS